MGVHVGSNTMRYMLHVERGIAIFTLRIRALQSPKHYEEPLRFDLRSCLSRL